MPEDSLMLILQQQLKLCSRMHHLLMSKADMPKQTQPLNKASLLKHAALELAQKPYTAATCMQSCANATHVNATSFSGVPGF